MGTRKATVFTDPQSNTIDTGTQSGLEQDECPGFEIRVGHGDRSIFPQTGLKPCRTLRPGMESLEERSSATSTVSGET